MIRKYKLLLILFILCSVFLTGCMSQKESALIASHLSEYIPDTWEYYDCHTVSGSLFGETISYHHIFKDSVTGSYYVINCNTNYRDTGKKNVKATSLLVYLDPVQLSYNDEGNLASCELIDKDNYTTRSYTCLRTKCILWYNYKIYRNIPTIWNQEILGTW